MLKLFLGAIAAVLVLVEPTRAEQYDTTPLFARGSWTVEHTYNSESGISWCVAQARNGAGQMFSIAGYDNGIAAVLLADPRWDVNPTYHLELI